MPWQELGLEKYLEIDGKKHAVYLKAAGPITGRPHKSGSGITYKHEIEALNDYKQLRMEKMEANDDGSVTITSVPKVHCTARACYGGAGMAGRGCVALRL